MKIFILSVFVAIFSVTAMVEQEDTKPKNFFTQKLVQLYVGFGETLKNHASDPTFAEIIDHYDKTQTVIFENVTIHKRTEFNYPLRSVVVILDSSLFHTEPQGAERMMPHGILAADLDVKKIDKEGDVVYKKFIDAHTRFHYNPNNKCARQYYFKTFLLEKDWHDMAQEVINNPLP